MSFERSRLTLLQDIQDVHKKDIKSYVSGHLNQSKLNKFENTRHETWATSKEAPVRLKPASSPVHLPVRKGQVTTKTQRQKNMKATLSEFSLGAFGCNGGFSGSTHQCGSAALHDSAQLHDTSQIRDKNRMDIQEHATLIEELRLPEIMFSERLGCPTNTKKGHSDVSSKRHFVKSYLGAVTKADQYEAMKNFEQTVMNLPDASDKGLLTGDRIVRKLNKCLSKKLRPLKDPSRRGPNFHRLQAYSDCFSEIIEQSKTFSRLLKLIKHEYDSYLAYTLDENRVSRHKALYSQMPSLAKAKSVAEAVQEQQKMLETAEDEVSRLLTENERLREEMMREKQKPVTTTTDEVIESESTLKTRVHVEEVPKDFQEQVEDFHCQIANQLETLEKMRKYQRENCVPSSVCQSFEQCIKETEVDIQKLLKQNEFLEQSIEELEQELEMMLSESGVSEKDARQLWKKVNISKVLEYGQLQNH